ncbi:tyrosine-protein phosphatase [Jatrophihabitans fulvus]
MTDVAWVELEGAANVRDVAGLPTGDGRTVQPRRLIRADNLQTLSKADVRVLVVELGVRTVVDLRTGAEVRGEGPGPLIAEPDVDVRHLSLFPETADATTDGADLLPWQARAREAERTGYRPTAAEVYLGYLHERPDSILAALRAIADPLGATVVHCAAGKDRTGVVVAFALAEVGVTHDAIVADYTRTAERIEAVLDRLLASETYAKDFAARSPEPPDPATHTPRSETMEHLLATVERDHGGVRGWLRAHGWTEDDAAALRAQLLG